MKANELMIGDWVYLPSIISDDKFPVQVLEIQDDCIKYYGGGKKRMVLFEHIEPIHLTPEILEKNGFITNDEQGNWKGYRIYSLFNTNKGCIFMLKLYEKDSIVEISLDMSPYYIVFKFVHQLQHALRLCGIEKTIEL